MEKEPQPHDVGYKAVRPHATVPIGRVVALISLTLLCGYNVLRWPFNAAQGEHNNDIIWLPCGIVAGHNVQCARLDVSSE